MVINIVFYILTAMTFIVMIRIILGPTVWDRLLGFNLVSTKINILIVLYALIADKSYLLDLALTFVFLSFISVIFIANFIEKKGKI